MPWLASLILLSSLLACGGRPARDPLAAMPSQKAMWRAEDARAAGDYEAEVLEIATAIVKSHPTLDRWNETPASLAKKCQLAFSRWTDEVLSRAEAGGVDATFAELRAIVRVVRSPAQAACGPFDLQGPTARMAALAKSSKLLAQSRRDAVRAVESGLFVEAARSAFVAQSLSLGEDEARALYLEILARGRASHEELAGRSVGIAEVFHRWVAHAFSSPESGFERLPFHPLPAGYYAWPAEVEIRVRNANRCLGETVARYAFEGDRRHAYSESLLAPVPVVEITLESLSCESSTHMAAGATSYTVNRVVSEPRRVTRKVVRTRQVVKEYDTMEPCRPRICDKVNSNLRCGEWRELPQTHCKRKKTVVETVPYETGETETVTVYERRVIPETRTRPPQMREHPIAEYSVEFGGAVPPFKWTGPLDWEGLARSLNHDFDRFVKEDLVTKSRLLAGRNFFVMSCAELVASVPGTRWSRAAGPLLASIDELDAAGDHSRAEHLLLAGLSCDGKDALPAAERDRLVARATPWLARYGFTAEDVRALADGTEPLAWDPESTMVWSKRSSDTYPKGIGQTRTRVRPSLARPARAR